MLTEREKLILKAVVEEYIETGEPISSKLVASKYCPNISPATIRNDMSVLEEMGYFSQPHPSAGRVPSLKGYKYYVENMLMEYRLSSQQRMKIRKILVNLESDITDLREVIKTTSWVIAQLSRLLAFGYGPLLTGRLAKKIWLTSVDENSVLLIYMTDSGEVAHKLIKTKYNRERLEAISNFFSSKLEKEGIEKIDIEEMKTFPPEDLSLLQEIISCLKEEEFSSALSYIEGTDYIDRIPEFNDPETLKIVIDLLNREEVVAQKISAAINSGNTWTSIGEKGNLTFIAIPYFIKEHPVGGAGVVGPLRMNYKYIIPLLNYISSCMSEILSVRWR
ncbi:MAG: heat-inducible transcriptional repressor HrcA [bacterium]